MIRETSLQAYAEEIRSGKIGKRQLLAWTVLQQYGPLTAAEIDQRAETIGLWKRLAELKRYGLIIEDEIRECSVTGKNVLTYRIAKPVPVPDRVQKKRKPRRWFLVVNEIHTMAYEEKRKQIGLMVAESIGADFVEVKEVLRK